MIMLLAEMVGAKGKINYYVGGGDLYVLEIYFVVVVLLVHLLLWLLLLLMR